MSSIVDKKSTIMANSVLVGFPMVFCETNDFVEPEGVEPSSKHGIR